MELKGNKAQNKAICHGPGPMLVLAGPGSGKTFVLTARIQYLIEEHHIKPENILVITFTKAAASGMRERFFRQIGSHVPVSFGTFHAIFYSILREAGLLQNGSILTETEKRKIVTDVLRLLCVEFERGEETLEALISDISAYKERREAEKRNLQMQTIFTRQTEALFTEECFLRIMEAYGNAVSGLRKADFDDLGILCLQLFESRPGFLFTLQSRYQYILIDEFQDISPLQYLIVKQLADPLNNLFAVGDDDQSIYGFRGAGPEIMLGFPREYPETKIIRLTVNYRSAPCIVDYSKLLISHNRSRYEKESKAYSKTSGKGMVSLLEFSGEEEEMEEICRFLLKKKKQGTLQNCAVLFRTGASLYKYREEFKIRGILTEGVLPGKMSGKNNALREEMLKDLEAYVRMATKDGNRSDFFRIMNKPVRYINREAVPDPPLLYDILPFYHSNAGMQDKIRRLFGDFQRISQTPPFLVIHYIRTACGYDRYRRTEITDPGELAAGTRYLNQMEEKSRECGSLAELLLLLEREREKTADVKKKKGDGSRPNGEKGPCLMTLHGAKGLEFETVIIPDCNERTIPHKRALSEEAVEEERRLFYVGVTRAKRELLLTCVRQKDDNRYVPSRFLKEMEL